MTMTTLLKTFQEEQDEKFNFNFRAPKPFDDGLYAVKADILLEYIHSREEALLKRIGEEARERILNELTWYKRELYFS